MAIRRAAHVCSEHFRGKSRVATCGMIETSESFRNEKPFPGLGMLRSAEGNGQKRIENPAPVNAGSSEARVSPTAEWMSN